MNDLDDREALIERRPSIGPPGASSGSDAALARIEELEKSRDRWEQLTGKAVGERLEAEARIEELEQSTKQAARNARETTMTELDELIAEGYKWLNDFGGGYQDYPGGPMRKYDGVDLIRNLTDALLSVRAERDAAVAAIERVRGILNRDDFGDDWEHDDWVYRDAAEKKLSEIEDVLKGVADD